MTKYFLSVDERILKSAFCCVLFVICFLDAKKAIGNLHTIEMAFSNSSIRVNISSIFAHMGLI